MVTHFVPTSQEHWQHLQPHPWDTTLTCEQELRPPAGSLGDDILCQPYPGLRDLSEWLENIFLEVIKSD